ncbi:MAG: hypothetical protein CSA54_00765 [Gammaproteobacteria bacterium]|nr:MAG: hypothetical protein CSA54_00765 [Gammaproteobacteria bacterium]
MKNIAEDVWVFDGETVSFLSFPFTTRMTIVALPDGDLWVHSPTRLAPALQARVDAMGRVRYIIAPNHLHHLFIKEWQQAYPDALLYGTEEVIRKRSDIAFNGTLDAAEGSPWEQELDQLLFTGSPFMQECVFLHRKTGVLVVADLIENFTPDALPFFKRQIAGLAGILAPNGKMPLDWRCSFFLRKREARRHVQRMLAWKPKKIVLSHGEIIEENAEEFLRRSFRWVKLAEADA